MSDALELPRFFDEHTSAAYTAEQLSPTLRRLRDAAADLAGDDVSAAALTSAWVRIAELRLPRKAVPTAVLAEIEELVVAWDAHEIGGIAAHAYALSDSERSAAAEQVRRLLALTEAAAASAPFEARYQTE